MNDKPNKNNFQENLKEELRKGKMPMMKPEWRMPAQLMGAAILAYGAYYYFYKSRPVKHTTVVTETDYPSSTGTRTSNQTLTAAKNPGVNINK